MAKLKYEKLPKKKDSSKTRNSRKLFSQGVRKIEQKTIRHARRFVSSRLNRLSTVRRSVFGWVTLALVLMGVSVFQLVSFRDSYVTAAPSSGGTYSEGVIGPLETLNPLFARTSAERSAARLLFASLYNYDETGNLKGDLAESVKINKDETEYTVKLLEGAKWSDGAPLTAEDVVFTTKLLSDPATGSVLSGLTTDPSTGVTISSWQLFKSQAVDSHTVKFTLPAKYAPFMNSLTFPILPQHALTGVKPAELREQPFSQAPITSGPFALRMLQNVTSDGTKKIAHLVANNRYRHGQPKLERFQLNVYSSREDLITALKTNEITSTPELIFSDTPNQIQQHYEKESYPVNNGVYAIFNTRDGLLKNRNIRQALAISVDRPELRKKVVRSVMQLEGPIIEGHIRGNLPKGLAYQPAKARKLLDKEGWTAGADGVRKNKNQEFKLKMVTLSGTGFRQTTEELAAVWRKELGIKVDVHVVDPLDITQDVLQTTLQPRDFDVLVYELKIGGDPDTYAFWHSSRATASGLNFANYRNALVDDALSSGRTKRDDKYRADRYRVFARQWLADVPALPLYQPKIDYIHSSSVKALNSEVKLVNPEDRYANVIYWTAGESPVYKTP